MKNESDLKKQAEKLFEDEDYNSAYKLYAQLVSNYPKDPEYNYRLGVCMLYTEPDKKKPFSYLKIATNSPKDAPKDAKFYLAKTYHINYQFDEAIKLYNEYKLIGSASSIKKLQVDREIEACKNGKRLLSNITDLVVISKKQLNEVDYFRSYDVNGIGIGGKLLVKPDDFKSAIDKKKKEKSVMYLPKTGDKVFYSSYGDKDDNGRDIYMATKTAGGFSKGVALPSTINTEYDEDYPFLHPNGKTLYFSSKGHNSMGGYDVFKTTYDDKTQTWSRPVNLEFPISSPDDDILYVTDSLERTAYFSTGRYSPFGKIDVLKINTERRPMNYAILKGTVVKEDVNQSLKSKITVKNLANNEIVGTFQAEDNGNYKMELPNGGKFLFTVETPELGLQSQAVNIPVAYNLKPYKQVISYDKKILKIINYFDGNMEDNYDLIRDLIEKKAKLEMSDEATIASSNTNKNSPNAVSSNNPTVTDAVNTNTTNATDTKSFSNEQLLEIAKTDAKEAAEESTKLKQEAEDAFGLATQKKAEAQNLKNEADALIASTNTMSEGSGKKETLLKADNKKNEAKIANDIATTASDLAKKLETDANVQKQEADLTNQYIKEIESVIKNKNNKEALAKLQQLQNQLNELSKQKNQSDELLASLKAEGELKQNELKKIEKKQESAKSTVTAITNETKELEKDLANETDNELKDNIKAQIRELNSELDVKTKELTISTEKYTALKTDVDGINKEIEMTEAVLNGKVGDITNNSHSTEGNLTSNASNLPSVNQSSVNSNTTGAYTLNYESITNNYKKELEKTATTKEELNNQTDALKMYNSDLADLIALDRDERFTANDNEKKKLNDEIKKIEKQKETNNKLIATNTSKLKEIDAKAITNTITEPLAVNTESNNTNSNANSINSVNSNSVANTALTATKQNTIASVNSNTNSIAHNTESVSVNTPTTNNVTATKQNTIASVNTNTNSIARNTESVSVNTPTTNNVTSVNSNNPTVTTNTIQVIETKNNSIDNPSSLFTYNDYKNPSSNELKESSLKKYNTALQNEADLKTQLATLENNTSTSVITTTDNASQLTTQAEKLNDEAFALRQQLATKKGAEKDAIQKQITEKETLALDTKFKAADAQQKENKEQFELNKLNLVELVKLTNNKPNADMSQANMLIDEAGINYNQSTNLREEANAYPMGSAKLGGLGNAEEKEAEALIKQQKAIDLLLKQNPNYKLKETQKPTNTADAIANINKKIAENNETKTEAFVELSKINQNELKTQGDKLQNNVAFNKPENKAAQELKTQSDNLKKEANDIIINQINVTTNVTEKQNLLITATNKEIEALKLLAEANQKLGTTITTQSLATNTSTRSNSTNNSQLTTNNENVTTNTQKNNDTQLSTNTPTNNNLTFTNQQSVNPIANNGGNGVSDEANKLKTNLSNTTEQTLPQFNDYTNNEAIDLKNKANETINSALQQDKTLATNLDDVMASASNTNTNTAISQPLSQQNINNLTLDAEKLNDQAFALRQSSSSKTGEEKEKAINEAKELENKSIDKKIEAAGKQEQLNLANYNANETSLKELETLAKGKNISELYVIEMQLTEAEIFMKQSSNLRAEANAFPNNASKLGGLNNAEEKEALALQKQEAALVNYKKYFTSYKPVKPNLGNSSTESAQQLTTVKNAVTTNEQKHVDGLMLLAEANKKEYDNRKTTLNKTLNANETTLKTKAETTYKQSQTLFAQAQQEPILSKKKNLLVDATKNGQDAISYLAQIKTNAIAKTSSTNTISATQTTNTTTQTVNPTNTTVINGANLQNTNGNGQIINTQAINTSTETTIPTAVLTATTKTTSVNNNTATNTLASGTTTKTTNGANLQNTNGKGQIVNTSSQASRTIATDNQNQTTDASNPLSNQPKTVLKVKEQELSVKNNNAYSDAKPIPLDEKMPRGLYFKVQIGSFKQPIPNSTFKGLTPLSAQTANNGYIRYMAGNFGQYEDANGLKNDLKKLGYTDAFVVAYFDGERIPLLDAPEKTSNNIEIKNNPNTSVGITTAANVPQNPFPTVTPEAATVSELEKINGLLYTIQVGIYSRPVAKGTLYNLRPLYRETLPNGLYRYTAGIYNQAPKVLEDKTKVNNLGIKDAFASSYFNGKRISFDEGRKMQAENNNIKMENQNPIIFEGAQIAFNSATASVTSNPTTNNQPQNTNTVQPFSNGVTNAPTPTADNGVKNDETGISYKVQVGAYRNQVPSDVVTKFMAIKTWPVSNVPINSLFIYTIGNFTSSTFAKKLKEEAIALGINDAFVTVYKDGKKLYGAEATEYLNK